MKIREEHAHWKTYLFQIVIKLHLSIIYFWYHNSHNFGINISLSYSFVESYSIIPSFDVYYCPFLR